MSKPTTKKKKPEVRGRRAEPPPAYTLTERDKKVIGLFAQAFFEKMKRQLRVKHFFEFAFEDPEPLKMSPVFYDDEERPLTTRDCDVFFRPIGEIPSPGHPAYKEAAK